jgi:hypothetical protein
MMFVPSGESMTRLQNDLRSVFDLTDLGAPAKIIGIEISQTTDTIMLSQPQYIDSILRKRELQNLNPISTPLDPNIKLLPNLEHQEPNCSNAYASLIGSLQANTTCPDIAYAINRLATYTANPSLAHYATAKRVLRYLKGTRNLGITYRAQHKRTSTTLLDANNFYSFSDAAYANANDNRSISGYVFLLNGGAIMWGSRKQTMITLSTTEAEYVFQKPLAKRCGYNH